MEDQLKILDDEISLKETESKKTKALIDEQVTL